MRQILLSGRDRVRDVVGALHTVDREGLPPRDLTPKERAAVTAATDCAELHRAIGRDFWVRLLALPLLFVCLEYAYLRDHVARPTSS